MSKRLTTMLLQKQIWLVLALGMLCCGWTSCINSRKIDKTVADELGSIPALKNALKPENVTVQTSIKLPDTSYLSSTTKTKNKVLPLILYIGFYEQYTTKLHPQIALNQLSNSIYQYARTKPVAEQLAGRQLLIEIDSIPLGFTFNIKGALYMLTITLQRVYRVPVYNDLVIRYTLSGGDQPTKKGQLSFADPNTALADGFFQTLQSSMREYLENYNQQMKKLGPQIVNRILSEQR
jgi:hypothetical protein